MAFLVPNRPIGSATRDIAALLANWDAMGVDYETGFSAYKDITGVYGVGFGSIAATTVLMNSVGLLQVAPAWDANGNIFDFDPADYASGTRTIKLRVRAWIAVNGIAPAITFKIGIYTVPVMGGGSGVIPHFSTVGALVAGSEAIIASPGAGAVTRGVSADITAPAASSYSMCVNTSGTGTANTQVVVMGKVQMRQV